jgi:hypothetical protein
VRRLLLVACLLVGLLSASAGSAAAMPHAKHGAKACKPAKKKKAAARVSTVGRPTPPRGREAKRRAAVKRATRKRCAKRKARRRAVAPKAPPAPAPSPQPGAPASPPAPGAPAPDDPAPPTVPEPTSNPFAVQVLSGEFFLHLSKPEVHAGNVRVEFNNSSAEDPHDLHLVREDGTGASYAFGELESGQVEARTLKLNAGSWRLFCALPQHAERGMSAKLRVVAG